MFECREEKGFNPVIIRIDCIEDLVDLINILKEHQDITEEGADDYPENIIELRQDLARIFTDQERG